MKCAFFTTCKIDLDFCQHLSSNETNFQTVSLFSRGAHFSKKNYPIELFDPCFVKFFMMISKMQILSTSWIACSILLIWQAGYSLDIARILTGDSQKLMFSTLTKIPFLIFWSDNPSWSTNSTHLACRQACTWAA